jgi:hypothetical protein
MLHLHPINSAQDAVNAAIILDFRNIEPEELSEGNRAAKTAGRALLRLQQERWQQLHTGVQVVEPRF